MFTTAAALYLIKAHLLKLSIIMIVNPKKKLTIKYD